MKLRPGLNNRRDLFGGGIMAVIGLAGIMEGQRLGAGTVSNMGPGYMPLALGVILVGLGLLMIVKPAVADANAVVLDRPEWRGWLCIILGVAGFIYLGQHAGLLAAAFGCVAIAALGDRTATSRGILGLAVCVTLFGVALFHYVLRVPIPLVVGLDL